MLSYNFHNFQGSQEIEGIFLDTSKIGELALSPLVFKQMPNLRLLKIDDWYRHKLHFPRGLQYLPDKLRYLNWSSYPLKSLPSSFTPSKLVKLVMRGCQLKHLWSGVQVLYLTTSSLYCVWLMGTQIVILFLFSFSMFHFIILLFLFFCRILQT